MTCYLLFVREKSGFGSIQCVFPKLPSLVKCFHWNPVELNPKPCGQKTSSKTWYSQVSHIPVESRPKTSL